MIRKLLVLATLAVMLSGCYVVPMALIGPATSGFSSASLIQSGFTSTASYLVKKGTGKSMSEHAFNMSEHAFNMISKDILKQTYFPKNNNVVAREYYSLSYTRFKTY